MPIDNRDLRLALQERVLANREEAMVISMMRGEKTLRLCVPAWCATCRMNWGRVWCGTHWRCEVCFEPTDGPDISNQKAT